MIFEIPVDAIYPVFEQVVQLDGVSFTFRCNWNKRAERWFLSIYDVDGEPVVLSVGLCPDMELLAGYRMVGRPAGELILLDDGEPQRDPQRDDLGGRARLYYLDAAEVEALSA